MAGSVTDDEIDRLYQLPLAEFTAARNALAKLRGAAGAAIRALEKPNLAAWAVNQLYWRKRAVFNRLIAAAEARRKAHGKLLSGKGGDVADAEAAHQNAVRAAADAVRAILADAGQDQSAATTHAVTETLQALPGQGTPGRLTGPLKLAGFEALTGLVNSGALPKLVPKPPSDAPASSAGDHAKREAAEEKRLEQTRKREQQDTEKALRGARREAKSAETSLAAARRELARAKEERQRLQDQLQFAIKKVEDASTDLREREQQATQASHEVSRLEAKLEALQ